MNKSLALKRWKVYLVLLIVLLVGIILLLIQSALQRSWITLEEPWNSVPWDSLGESFVGAFLVGFIYEGLIRRETEALLNDTIQSSLIQQRSNMLYSLTLDSATNIDSLRKLSDTELNNATKAVLTARLGEASLARDISESLLPQAAPNIELTRDFQVRVQFLEDGDLDDEPGRYFVARISVSYVRRLRRDCLRFGVTDSTPAIFGRIGSPNDYDVVWHTNRMGRYHYDDPRTFHLEYVRVDENDLSIVTADELITTSTGEKASVRSHSASHEALVSAVGEEVKVAYCYIAKVPKLGHLLHFPLAQTSAGVRYEFDLGDVGIDRATIVPFFLSASRPLVREQKF
ncbi:hypothetical protein ABZX92_02455 [Lentzea sp. NPDC006480]|uniref:hypothetical protein n=1 Tax=Lentzea sp. NPDC006480 TaxID=3157176 RepID=UPI00339EF714